MPSPSESAIAERYSRQILFAPIGLRGQEKICSSRVVIIGCGALGTAQAAALARAGVGALRIVDRDFVEPSNLQRQSLFDETDAAARLPKATAAAEKLRTVNSACAVEGVVEDFDSRNAVALLQGFDLVVDGTDNFETRYLLNDAAVSLGLPWIYGAVVGSYAASMTIRPGYSACLACLLPQPPQTLQQTCDTAGVIAPAVAWAAAIQVSEALKILTGNLGHLHGRLLGYDIWTNEYHQVWARRREGCEVCGQRQFRFLEGTRASHVSLCGRNSVQIHLPERRDLNLEALRARLAAEGPVRGNAYLVQCRVGEYELTVFRDGRAVVQGTQDAAVARSLYARYVGA
jgi:molybdopterin/thiamine biosynthesis adenylyltransferase